MNHHQELPRPNEANVHHVVSPDPKVDACGRKKRALHVEVPDEAYRAAKHAALNSDLSFKAYMARLMLSAKPMVNEQ